MTAAERASTVSELIFSLQRYWVEHGCVLVLPYDLEKGAGTFNPATFLRVLGPEEWACVFVEPCRRPKDGRYGKNPNRLHQHHQVQVILKPAPDRFLDLYLGSLDHVGVDARAHDLRFLEDDWESPTLGASGLGWQVWLDGLEITQVTYFQQAGGIELPVVSGELTYGIERLAMHLQGVESVFDLRWGDSVSYGDLFLRAEEEYSAYGFEFADPVLLRSEFESAEREVARLLEAGLVRPAYDGVVRASHLFNLLDARRAVSVTERAGLVGRVRRLARRTAEAHLRQREELGHPLRGKVVVAPPPEVEVREGATRTAASGEALLELAVEELPAPWVAGVARQAAALARKLLGESALACGRIEANATRTRIVLLLEGVAPQSKASEEDRVGPAWAAAFDAQGNPTAAARGFARGCGVDVSGLVRTATAKGDYAVATIRTPGRAAAEVLPEVFAALVSGLSFPKSMRWRPDGFRFGRPLRRILARFEGAPVPVAGFPAADWTVGHASLSPGAVRVASVADYRAALSGVVLSPEERSEAVAAAVAAAGRAAGGETVPDPELLERCAGAVESPAVVAGGFDPRFLELPPEIVRTALREHQMAFAVQSRPGRLLPGFLVVYDGSPSIAAGIRAGHERVVRARLSDAAFFWDEDRKVPPVERVRDLAGVVWRGGLGTLLDKTERVRGLVAQVVRRLRFTDKQRELADRAALLYRTDQVSLLIGEKEFAGLSGTVGRALALAAEEPFDVAQAIEEACFPRAADGELPATEFGAVLSVCDRMDSLVGLLSAGEAPTGSEDPLGVRRDAAAVLRILRRFADGSHHAGEHGGDDHSAWRIPVSELLRNAAEGYPAAQLAPDRRDAVVVQAVELLRSRLEGLLTDEGAPPDAVQAVLAAGLDPVPAAFERASALAALRGQAAFEPAVRSFLRVFNMLLKERYDPVSGGPRSDLLETEAERRLFDAARAADEPAGSAAARGDFAAVWSALMPLAAPIDAFFETTRVMDAPAPLRDNRIALLSSVRRTLLLFCDFRALHL